MLIREILENVFDSLDKYIQHYVVMNKYDEIPDSLPSDIDFCIPLESYKNLDKIIKKVAINANLLVVQKIWHNYHKCAYILTPLNIDGPFRLQLDFFVDFAVEKTPLLISYKDILSNTRKYGRYPVPAFEIEYVFLLMRRVYKNDFDDEHCFSIRKALMGNVENSIIVSKKYFPVDKVQIIADSILKNDVLTLKKMRNELWKHLQNLSKKNSMPIYFVKYWAVQLWRYIYRLRTPVGIDISFICSNDTEKAKLIEEVKRLVWGAFHGTVECQENSKEYMHMKNTKLDKKSINSYLLRNSSKFRKKKAMKLRIIEAKKKLVIYSSIYFDILNNKEMSLIGTPEKLCSTDLCFYIGEANEFFNKINGLITIEPSMPFDEKVDTIIKNIFIYKANKVSKFMHMTVDKYGVLVKEK